MPIHAIDDRWRAPAPAQIDARMRFAERALVVGAGTVLAKLGVSEQELEPRLSTLLAAAHLRRPSATATAHLRRAIRCSAAGDAPLAAMHLALSGLDQLISPAEDAHRLVLADALLDAGLAPDALLRALGLEAADSPLAKYSADQPRVPAGSGRASGQWTTDGAAAGGAAPQSSAARPPAPRPSHPARGSLRSSGPHSISRKPSTTAARPVSPTAARPSARASQTLLAPGPLAAAGVVSRAPAAGIDLGALSEGALRPLASWLLKLAGAAETGAVAGGFGLALIPSSLTEGKRVNLPGPGEVSYFAPPDGTVAYFKYTTRDGVRRTITATRDPARGGYRDPEGRTLARSVKTAGKTALIVATAALAVGDDEGRVCPAPVEDNGGKRGQEYENYMKAWFNPDNPTPPGMAYEFFDPAGGKWPKIDDCQHHTGALAEYKGPGFEEHLLKEDRVWKGMLSKMLRQAESQNAARGNRSLTWFFAEKPVADVMRERFERLGYAIEVDWHPIVGR